MVKYINYNSFILYTAITLAAKKGHTEIVKLLLHNNKVNPSARNNKGKICVISHS